MTRLVALAGGLAAIVVTVVGMGFALWATSDGSVIGGVGEVAVLALAGTGCAVAWAGAVVAVRGIAHRAWVLHGTAVSLTALTYALSMTIAENV